MLVDQAEMLKWAWNKFNALKMPSETLVLLALSCHGNTEPQLTNQDIIDFTGLSWDTIEKKRTVLCSIVEDGIPLVQFSSGSGKKKTSYKINFQGTEISPLPKIHPPEISQGYEIYPLQKPVGIGTKSETKSSINNKNITNSKYINVIKELRQIVSYNLSEDQEVALIGWLGSKNIQVEKAESTAINMVNKLHEHVDRKGNCGWKYLNYKGEWAGYYKTIDKTFQAWSTNTPKFANSEPQKVNMTNPDKFSQPRAI